MKIFIFLSRFLSVLCLFFCTVIFAVIAYLNIKIPDELFLMPNETVNTAVNLDIPFKLAVKHGEITALDVIPIKSVLVQNVSEEVVIPCGFPIGVASGERAAAGMMTFYDPNSRNFAGFGHVAEVSGEMLLYSAKIQGSSKSTSNALGALDVMLYNEVGVVTGNSDSGICGVLQGALTLQNPCAPVPICPMSEVSYGAAWLVTTIDGDEPVAYEVIISEQTSGYASCKNADFTIEVTDETLLEKTGGILQGMSGSPIIKNGKLIGALNQALTENAKVGYGIFAEKMAF